MITQLNPNSNSWTRIFKIDLSGSHPDQEYEEYFATQLDIITTQQFKLGFYLRATTMFGDCWILTFTPQNNNCRFPSGREN